MLESLQSWLAHLYGWGDHAAPASGQHSPCHTDVTSVPHGEGWPSIITWNIGCQSFLRRCSILLALVFFSGESWPLLYYPERICLFCRITWVGKNLWRSSPAPALKQSRVNVNNRIQLLSVLLSGGWKSQNGGDLAEGRQKIAGHRKKSLK